MLTPELSLYMANLNMLSPDGLCYSFDHRANGYSRAEGVIVLVLKTLSTAIRDGDNIRAVVRETGSNQDGRTPGITQPSSTSQESLIRQVYSRCDVGFESTRYVEAHGKWNAMDQTLTALVGPNNMRRDRDTAWGCERNESHWCCLQGGSLF